MNLFNRSHTKNEILKKPIAMKIMNESKKEDIFDRLKKETLVILNPYKEPERIKIEISNEIVSLVKNEISKIKFPEKIIEKVVENRIVEKIEPKEIVRDVIDEQSRKLIDELRDEIKKLKTEIENEKDNVKIISSGTQLPDASGKDYKYLTSRMTPNGRVFEWLKPTDLLAGEGIVFQPVSGTYYKLDVNSEGVVQTTQVIP